MSIHAARTPFSIAGADDEPAAPSVERSSSWPGSRDTHAPPRCWQLHPPPPRLLRRRREWSRSPPPRRQAPLRRPYRART
eukprot:2332714-Prymnesium_polylepis.1